MKKPLIKYNESDYKNNKKTNLDNESNINSEINSEIWVKTNSKNNSKLNFRYNQKNANSENKYEHHSNESTTSDNSYIDSDDEDHRLGIAKIVMYCRPPSLLWVIWRETCKNQQEGDWKQWLVHSITI